jgi:rubredoxin
MTPRSKRLPDFDFSLPCPACGYKIPPNQLMRLASHTIQCPACRHVFDEMAGKKPLSTS